MIRAHHSLYNISIYPTRTFIRRDRQIIMMYVPSGKTNLKEICSQGDRSSHRSKIRSFRGCKVPTNAIRWKNRRNSQEILILNWNVTNIPTKASANRHQKKPGLFDAIDETVCAPFCYLTMVNWIFFRKTLKLPEKDVTKKLKWHQKRWHTRIARIKGLRHL